MEILEILDVLEDKVESAKNIPIINRAIIDKEDLFKAEKIIVDQICADCLNRGIIKVDSEENFAYAVPRQLLGRYSLKI